MLPVLTPLGTKKPLAAWHGIAFEWCYGAAAAEIPGKNSLITFVSFYNFFDTAQFLCTSPVDCPLCNKDEGYKGWRPLVNSHPCDCSGQTKVDDKPHFCSSVETVLLSLVWVLPSGVPIFFVVNVWTSFGSRGHAL